MSKYLKNKFADLLQKYMNEAHLTDALLAWKTGYTRQTIRRWRIGETQPACKRVSEIARILKNTESINFTRDQCEEFLWAAGCKPTLIEFANQPILAQPRKPILQPHDFFGREAVLKRIQWAWDHNGLQNIALIGPRTSGKTSLLHYLEGMSDPSPQLRPDQPKGWQAWRPVDIQFAVIDFHDPGMYQVDVLFREIFQQLDIESPIHEDLDTFVKKLSKIDKPTVIMMDEVHAGLLAPTIDNKFWYSMRYLSGRNPYLGLLVTARKSVDELALDSGKPSPFFNLFGNIELEPFTQNEAQELLDHLPSAVSQADKAWILETSQCWPALLQLLCNERLFALEQDYPEKLWKNKGLKEIKPLLSYFSTSLNNADLYSPKTYLFENCNNDVKAVAAAI